MKSIKSKLVLSISVICLISILLCSSIGYYFSYRTITEEATNKINMASEKYAEIINGWLSSQVSFIDSTVTSIEYNENYDAEHLGNYLKTAIKNNKDVMTLLVGFKDKRVFSSNPDADFTNYDCTQRDWFKNTLSSGELIYSSPYIDFFTKKMVITISKPIKKNNEIIGVVGADINLDSITTLINSATPIENSTGFLLDKDNNFMVHANKDFLPNGDKVFNLEQVLDGNLKSLASLDSKNKNSLILEDYDKEKKMFTRSIIPATNWSVGFSVPMAEFKKPLNVIIIAFISIACICLLISTLFALIFGKKLSNPILKISEMVNQTKDLDLTDNKDYDFILNYKDEIGVIGSSVVKLREELRKIIEQLKSSSNNVQLSSQSINKETEETVYSIDAISKTIDELAKGSVDQATDAQNGSEKLMSLVEKIKITNDNVAIVKNHSLETQKVSEDGISSMVATLEKFKENSEITENLGRNIDVLYNKSSSIDEIVASIQSIAEQTNLLALNAAIEAARAGEAGRGFAVVAEEIKKLAEQTSLSTKEISTMISEVQIEITTAKNNMDISSNVSKEVNTSISLSKESFDTIANSVHEIIASVNILVENIEKVYSDKDQVLSAIEGISAVSQESAAATEEVSASMEEQASSMMNIGETTKKLAEISTALNDIVNQFKI